MKQQRTNTAKAIEHSAQPPISKYENPFLKRFKVLLPSSINLDNLLLDHPFQPSYHKNKPLVQRDRLAYVLGQIYSSLVNTTGENFPENQWTSICSINLQKVIKNYKEYVQYAIDIGLIVCNDDYYFNNDALFTKTRCMKYKFSKKYFDKTTRWTSYYIYDKHVIEKSKRWSVKPYTEQIQYYNILRSFDHLNIDLDAARLTLNDIYPSNPEIVDFQIDLARRLKYKELQSFTIGKTGRLYTPFSNLKKEIRQHITLNGQQLYEIDLVNSIPYMSLVLFDNDRLEHHKVISDLVIKANPILNPAQITDNEIRLYRDCMDMGWGVNSYLGLGRGIHVHLGKNQNIPKSANIEKFKEMVLDGSVYQFMSDIWNADHL